MPVTPEKTKVQFNARIGKNHKRDIKTDAARTDDTIDNITETIIAKFFKDHPAKAREQFYKDHAQAA